jgi:heat shock protein HslJ
VTLPGGAVGLTVAAGRIVGSLGCNAFIGDAVLSADGSFAVSRFSQNDMVCLDADRLDFEVAYGQALLSITSWAVDSAGLTLTGPTAEIGYSKSMP